jgi:hypothetical protein
MQADLFTEITAEEAIAYNGGGWFSRWIKPLFKPVIKTIIGTLLAKW